MGNFLGLTCKGSDDKPVPSITKNRGCTDVPLLAMYLISWIVIFYLFGKASSLGADPDRLIRGVDVNDRICGKDKGVENLPFAAWPIVPGTVKTVNPSTAFDIKVCVETCNDTWNREGEVTLVRYPSKPFLKYYCLPGNVSVDGFSTAGQRIGRAVGDLKTSWALIMIMALVAVLLSFVYAWFCKKFAGVLIWGSIALILLGGFLISLSFVQKADEIDKDPLGDKERSKALKGFGYLAGITTVIFLFIIVFLRKRIQIAIAVVKEASKAIGQIPGIVAFPILPFVFATCYAVFWIFGAMFIFSANNVREFQTPLEYQSVSLVGTTYKDREFNQDLRRALGFHFFHLLWSVQFIIYFCYLTVAGVIADWYFTPYGPNGSKPRGEGENELSEKVVSKSLYRTVRYHLGTIAYGSLIIAAIQFARACITYLQKQSKDKKNKVQEAVFCMIQCCLKCLECCMDKVSKNAFIHCAVYGNAFCPSAYSSFSLVWRNLARVAAINMVGDYLIVIGKVLVSFTSTGIAGMILVKLSYYEERISSPIFPCLLIFILSFLIASIFMVIYETAIDTIFMCFLIDEEHNKGKSMLASENLQKIINEHAKESKELADKAAGTSPTPGKEAPPTTQT